MLSAKIGQRSQPGLRDSHGISVKLDKRSYPGYRDNHKLSARLGQRDNYQSDYWFDLI